MSSLSNAFENSLIDWIFRGQAAPTLPASLHIGLFTAAPTEAGAVAVVWVAGGVEGQTYRLRNGITTTGGRIDSREIVIDCTHRRS